MSVQLHSHTRYSATIQQTPFSQLVIMIIPVFDITQHNNDVVVTMLGLISNDKSLGLPVGENVITHGVRTTSEQNA